MTVRPSLSLALIAKNEAKNINRLLDSVEGCFDEIVLVDTGSTDETKALAEARECKVFDFIWVNDFAKARNFAFAQATCDFVMWLDLDDVLCNRDEFIAWRNDAMEFRDMWLATYHYASDEQGVPQVSFVRERVFKRSNNPVWQYPVHEGILAKPGWVGDMARTWNVKHMRDAEDMKQDRSRNIQIIEGLRQAGTLDARMTFYYGKELFENGEYHKAVEAFEDALKLPTLEPHDKLLSYQYAAYSAAVIGDQLKDEHAQAKHASWHKAIGFAMDGLKLDPNRAEFNITIGDCYLKMGLLHNAVPAYAAAKVSFNPGGPSSVYQGPIFSFAGCYGEVPTVQLATIYLHMGRLPEAKAEAQEAIDKYDSAPAKELLAKILEVEKKVSVGGERQETKDIVFLCPPQSAYEFDEELYKTKGMGGSETALIEMAKELKALCPDRSVKVFNMRQAPLVADSGVEYIPNSKANDYFSVYKPAVNINWRLNMKITDAPTYLWAHDLLTPTVESQRNFKKMMTLSSFHTRYTKAMCGVPDDMFFQSRNGIVKEKFEKVQRKAKNRNKLVWMSSPDRGLDRAMKVCDLVRNVYPNIELHVYYGLENLYKYGLGSMADDLKAKMSERPWVKYHGFTEQSKMYEEVSDAVVWVHPCNFIETFCITALEMQALGIYPVTRRLGALADTLGPSEKAGMCTMLDSDCDSPEAEAAYASAVIDALANKKWEGVSLELDQHSWAAVAKEWAKEMEFV